MSRQTRHIALALVALVAAAAVADAAALPTASLLAKGRSLLQGWPRPTRRYCTSQGQVVVAPYSLSVGNLVGGNLFMPNVYTRGRGNCISKPAADAKPAATNAKPPGGDVKPAATTTTAVTTTTTAAAAKPTTTTVAAAPKPAPAAGAGRKLLRLLQK